MTATQSRTVEERVDAAVDAIFSGGNADSFRAKQAIWAEFADIIESDPRVQELVAAAREARQMLRGETTDTHSLLVRLSTSLAPFQK